MFSERLANNQLNIVINGCKDCLFHSYNKDFKRECFFTKDLVYDEKWGTTMPENCPLGFSFKSQKDEIISFARHSYSGTRNTLSKS